MRLFKRISSTVLASVDKVVSEVENHDAVVESMLGELTQAAAESKIRLKRVQQDGKKMHDQLNQLTASENQWTQRATTLANLEDEQSQQKALACLERRRKCREQIDLLKDRLTQYSFTEQRLVEQLETIESRHAEISNKRHLLQSQQAVAEANRVVAAVTMSGAADINDALDRWEIAIAKQELRNPEMNFSTDESLDSLEAEFIKSEAKDELLAELTELKQTTKDNTKNKTDKS